MTPAHLLIGGAILAGAILLSDDDDKKQSSEEQQTKRILSENQLPSYAKKKLEMKRREENFSDDAAIDFKEIEKMFAAGKSKYNIKNELQLLELKAKRQRNARAMNFIANYYHRLGDSQKVTACYELACSFD